MNAKQKTNLRAHLSQISADLRTRIIDLMDNEGYEDFSGYDYLGIGHNVISGRPESAVTDEIIRAEIYMFYNA